MCGISSGIIGDKEVDIFVGYYGGSLRVDNDCVYSSCTEPYTGSREDCIKYFGRFSKVELLNMLADFVENAEEG